MLKVFNLPVSKWKLLLLAGDLVIFWVSARSTSAIFMITARIFASGAISLGLWFGL